MRIDGQQGPPGVANASSMEVSGNWNHIEKVRSVDLGVLDEEGNPVIDEPKKPLTVTFEPAGCGRVLYSTYHTTHNTHSGLMRQERILLYLIMEIGVCNGDPIIE